MQLDALKKWTKLVINHRCLKESDPLVCVKYKLHVNVRPVVIRPGIDDGPSRSLDCFDFNSGIKLSHLENVQQPAFSVNPEIA